MALTDAARADLDDLKHYAKAMISRQNAAITNSWQQNANLADKIHDMDGQIQNTPVHTGMRVGRDRANDNI
jgi:peptidoglycan hydrolase CwlO-like protein